LTEIVNLFAISTVETGVEPRFPKSRTDGDSLENVPQSTANMPLARAAAAVNRHRTLRDGFTVVTVRTDPKTSGKQWLFRGGPEFCYFKRHKMYMLSFLEKRVGCEREERERFDRSGRRST
jgi:hypothetical protein